MNLERTKLNVLAPYLRIVFSMSSVTSQIELKCYCPIIAVGDELNCRIKTGGDYLEQLGDETFQEYCMRSTCHCSCVTSRHDVERLLVRGWSCRIMYSLTSLSATIQLNTGI
jgi:hypothetical protein